MCPRFCRRRSALEYTFFFVFLAGRGWGVQKSFDWGLSLREHPCLHRLSPLAGRPWVQLTVNRVFIKLGGL